MLDLIFKDGKLIRRSLDVTVGDTSKKQQVIEWLVKHRSSYLSLKPDTALVELAYSALHCLNTPPQCKTCGAFTKFGRTGWAKFCNAKCAMSNDSTKETKRENSIKKWGVPHQFLREDVVIKKQAKIKPKVKKEKKPSKAFQKRQKIEINKQVKKQKIVDLLGSEFNSHEWGKNGKLLSVKHKCGEKFESPRLPLVCHICFAPKKQRKQYQFFDKLNLQVEHEKRIGKMKFDAVYENIAFEFNGLYWHSQAPQPGNRKPRDPFYHQRKMLLAKEHGYRLVQLWDFNGADNERIVQNLISQKKIYARNCVVKEISKTVSSQFLNMHHRDKNAKGCFYSVGLYHGDDLIGVATFSKPRYDKSFDSELLRLCFAHGVCVVGGVSKLISHFRSKFSHMSLMTYSSADWGWGEGYTRSGAEFNGITKPGYFYFDQKTNTKLHRIACCKKNFKKTTGIDWDNNLTEEENCEKLKLYRVYDCGNWKFSWPPLENSMLNRRQPQ